MDLKIQFTKPIEPNGLCADIRAAYPDKTVAIRGNCADESSKQIEIVGVEDSAEARSVVLSIIESHDKAASESEMMDMRCHPDNCCDDAVIALIEEVAQRLSIDVDELKNAIKQRIVTKKGG